MFECRQNKVKIIAVAKDVGAYLAEWIHHHLYYGFSNIEIVLNRTADNSIQVLEHISKVYPAAQWRFVESSSEKEYSVKSSYSDAFIYHRFHWSEIDYNSSLYRGRSGLKDVFHKTNRSGLSKIINIEHENVFPNKRYTNYLAFFEKYIEMAELLPLIKFAKAFERFEQAVKSVLQYLPVFHKQILKLFRKVTEPRITNAIARFNNKLVE